jgi:hypothetical protein
MPLFRSPILGNYNLTKEFPGKETATNVPEKIKKLMGVPEGTKNFVGAYPLE